MRVGFDRAVALLAKLVGDIAAYSLVDLACSRRLAIGGARIMWLSDDHRLAKTLARCWFSLGNTWILP
jgi:hypothetical protein